MGLHLEYRLWIAELNADVSVLRIFDDYIADVSTKNTSKDVLKSISDFKDQFINLRTEMDELRHEMHLNKMKLAAVAKTGETSADIEGDIHHKTLEKRYTSFKKNFQIVQNKFQQCINEINN